MLTLELAAGTKPYIDENKNGAIFSQLPSISLRLNVKGTAELDNAAYFQTNHQNFSPESLR